MAKKKRKTKAKGKKRITAKSVEKDFEQRLLDIKRHALVVAIQNKPETRLIDVIELASRLGLGEDITIGDLQQANLIPEQLALAPASGKSPRKKVSPKKAAPKKSTKKAKALTPEERKKIKEKIIRVLKRQDSPVGAADLRYALGRKDVTSEKMTALMRELVKDHKVAYEGNTSKRVYYALN